MILEFKCLVTYYLYLLVSLAMLSYYCFRILLNRINFENVMIILLI
jgi:hypothetical protein